MSSIIRYIHDFGTKIAVGLKINKIEPGGDYSLEEERELTEYYYLYYNWKATNGGLYYFEDIYYFWTDWDTFKSGLRNIVEHRFATMSNLELEEAGFQKKLDEWTEEELNLFSPKCFLPDKQEEKADSSFYIVNLSQIGVAFEDRSIFKDLLALEGK